MRTVCGAFSRQGSTRVTPRHTRLKVAFGLILLSAVMLSLPLGTSEAQRSIDYRTARVLDVSGPIGPPLADFVIGELHQAQQHGDALIVLKMDTPGGLDRSMRRIIKEILSSSVPVITYVAPNGARAASAGTYILYASHIAAMAPGTNLGAATPVQLGGLPTMPDRDGETGADDATDRPPSNEDSLRTKVINDAVAYIKGLAELRGRNSDWAVRAVRQGESLTASEALRDGVIDLIAVNLTDLLSQVDGRTVLLGAEQVVVNGKNAVPQDVGQSWVTRLLIAITDPNIAFLLMTIGFYGLFFELLHPGGIVPGTIGGISLLLGLYALSVLPVSLAGAALLLLGLALMIAEAFVPSFGILGLGGLVSFALGATMLFDTNAPGFQLSWQTIAGTTLVTGVFMAAILALALKSQLREVTTGPDHLLRQTATVESWANGQGWVLVEGERWKAVSDTPLSPGQTVTITKIDGLVLTVAPLSP